MSEIKSIYDGGTIGLPGSDIQVSDNVARWTGNPIYHENGSGCEKFIPLNGEPLSTKQLHEVITSQAITIDRLLGEVNRYKQAFVEVGECLQKGNYIKAGGIIREMK
jgi:hypothetical protein